MAEPQPNYEKKTVGPRWKRRVWVIALVLYALVLGASHLWELTRGPADPPRRDDRRYVTIPAMSDDGPLGERSLDLAYLRFAPQGDTTGREPVILIHGSPGDAGNFTGLGRELVTRGRMAIAPDLPGFAGSTGDVPRLSLESHARSMFAMMDALGIERAHVAAWSQGGGVALYMAAIAPERVASIGLIASIGAQRTEGSGSYWFEHAKYALAYALFVIGPELVPDFGAIPVDPFFAPFARNFLHSDQRPLEGIMRSTEVPILIIQGRHDFLLADWAAEVHHEIAPASSLLMLDAGHFLVWGDDLETTANALNGMFTRHDLRGTEPLRETRILAPPRPTYTGPIGSLLGSMAIHWPWWATAIVIVIGTFVAPWMTLSVCALSIGVMRLDFAVAIVGLTGGRALRRKPGLNPGWWIATPLALCVALALAVLPTTRAVESSYTFAGPVGGLVAVLAIGWSIRLALLSPRLVTARGRADLGARWGRVRWHEYWPTKLRYGLLVPPIIWFGLRRRGLLAFTACNPGISHGGGVAGESKQDIMDGLEVADNGNGRLLRSVLDREDVPPADMTDELVTRRAERIAAIIEGPQIGGYPAIVKPESGQNGAGVSVIRRPEQILEHLHRSRDPLTNTSLAHCGGRYVRDTGLIIQQYHPGPHECGLLWIRYPDGPRRAGGELRHGFIYSLVEKTLPVLTGDGRRSMRELIWAHIRHRCQAEVLIAGLHGEADEVPPAGARVEVGRLGNHCRGAIFTDGAHLISRELERCIDDISNRFPAPDGAPGGLDVGRYDIRYSSDADLSEGRFSIIELNGVTGESANCYDPFRSAWWSLSVMRNHWRLMYELGARRRESGSAPISALELARIGLRP